MTLWLGNRLRASESDRTTIRPETWLRRTCGRRASCRLGIILLQPGLHQAARRLGHIEKTNSGAAAGVLPGHLSRQANQLLLARKSELEINFAGGRKAVGGLDRSSAVAEVGQDGVQFRRSGIGDVGRRITRSARSAAAFAAHEAASGAQTDAGAFGRERAIENKIRAKPEHGTSVELAVDNGNQHAGAVLGGLPQARQEFLGTLVGAIVENDGIKALAVEQFQPAGDRGRMLGRHPQLGQDEREQAG